MIKTLMLTLPAAFIIILAAAALFYALGRSAGACPYCGKKIRPSYAICPYCSHQLNKEEEI